MRVAAVALVATVAFVAAGCGGSSTTSSSSMTPLELVSQAVSKTTKADSAKFRMALTETLGPLGPVTVNAEGTSNTATRSAKMTMDLSSVAQFVGADAGEPGDWQGEVIVDGSNPKAVVEYMRVPAFSKLIPNAKPWLKIDLNTLTKGQGIDFTQFLQTAGGQDPTQALQMLRRSATSKRSVRSRSTASTRRSTRARSTRGSSRESSRAAATERCSSRWERRRFP